MRTGGVVLLALFILVTATALPGCKAGPNAPIVIDFWAMGTEGELVRELVPGFEARTPGVSVRVQTLPWSAAHEKLITAFVGGSLPDAFQLGSTWIAEFVQLGALEPLDARLASSRSLDRADFFPGILAASVVDGTTWGLPWYVDTRLLFYRRDLLERAGVSAAPRSWEAWRDAMARVKQSAGPDAYAILLPVAEWETPVILALQSGARLLRDGDRFGDFESDAFRRAFSFYLDLFATKLAPTGGDAQAASLVQGFAEGFFSFIVTGPWNLGELARRLPPELADAWTTAPMPAAADGDYPGVSIAGGASLALAHGSDPARRDAAWRWLEYLTDTEQQVSFYGKSGDLPSRRTAWQQAGLEAEPRVRAFATQLERVEPVPRVPEWERIAARIAQHAEAAIRGRETIDEALAALNREADEILAKRRWILDRAAGGRPSGADGVAAPGSSVTPPTAGGAHSSGTAAAEHGS